MFSYDMGGALSHIPRISYFVCTSPRTGSWLLTDMLCQTGIAGRPAKRFDPNPEHERDWIERLGRR
jgi:LPS sulfotransferase NodH